jgi:DNA-binding NarL/FixJ family response regulator
MVGQSNREIAKRLYLSPRTVEVHVSNLLGKLGATNREQAKRAATHLGLLPEG